MATQAVKPTAAKKKRALRQNTKPLLLIALPGILYLLINNYLPMIGIFLAFKDYSYIKGPFKSNWCGFKNFEFFVPFGCRIHNDPQYFGIQRCVHYYHHGACHYAGHHDE